MTQAIRHPILSYDDNRNLLNLGIQYRCQLGQGIPPRYNQVLQYR